MLSSLLGTNNAASQSGADKPKPVLAVSKAMAKDGLEKGMKMRVKYVVPEEHRSSMEGRKLWIGVYKDNGSVSVVPVIRCDGMEGVLEIETAAFEVGGAYVCSLREGEVWPLITTHCTTDKVVMLAPAEQPQKPSEQPQKPPPPAVSVSAHDPLVSPPLPTKPAGLAVAKKTASWKPKLPLAAAAVEEQTPPRSAGTPVVAVTSTSAAASSATTSPRRGLPAAGMSSAPSAPVGSPRSMGSPRGGSPLPALPAVPGAPSSSSSSAAPRNAGSSRPAAAPPQPAPAARNAESSRPQLESQTSPRESERKGVPEKLVVRMLEELSIRTRQHNGREVPLSFTGISLVSWLVQTVKTIESREEGVKWGRAMMRQDIFFAADDGQPFCDEHVPFVINLDHALVGPHWARVASAARRPGTASSSPTSAPVSPRRGPSAAAITRTPPASIKSPRQQQQQQEQHQQYDDDYK